MSGWTCIAVASIVYLVGRHPVAQFVARAIALPGATSAGSCLPIGSTWGRPIWGTWWHWHGRITSILLPFVHTGYAAFSRVDAKRGGDGVTVRIAVTNGVAAPPMTFAGIVSELFCGRSAVLAEDRFRPDGAFAVSNLLAEHDEKYVPPQVRGATHETRTLDP